MKSSSSAKANNLLLQGFDLVTKFIETLTTIKKLQPIKKRMDRKSIKQYLTYKFRKGRVAYPNTSNLFYTGTKVDEKFNLRVIKDLRDKNKNSKLSPLLYLFFEHR